MSIRVISSKDYSDEVTFDHPKNARQKVSLASVRLSREGWTGDSVIMRLQIELSTDGFLTWIVVAASEPEGGDLRDRDGNPLTHAHLTRGFADAATGELVDLDGDVRARIIPVRLLRTAVELEVLEKGER